MHILEQVKKRLPEATEVTCGALREFDLIERPNTSLLTADLGDLVCRALGSQITVSQAITNGSGYGIRPSEAGQLTILSAIGLSRLPVSDREKLFDAWVVGSTGEGGIAPVRALTRIVGYFELDQLSDPHDAPQVTSLLKSIVPRPAQKVFKLFLEDARHYRRPPIA